MTTHQSDVRAWFAGRLPDDWTTLAPAEITIDREEITIVLMLTAPDLGDDASAAERAAALDGRVTGFRDDTRDHRIRIAVDAEHRFGRKVSWGVAVGDERRMFTHLAAPAMTRLRQPERQVLDTLVAANVARSRADALAWCVRLVGQNIDEWLTNLRAATEAVDEIRNTGPT